MTWQDGVIAGGQWFFVLTLLPLWKEPPPMLTAVPTGLILGLFAFAFATLGLTNAALSSVASCSMWCALGVRRWVRVQADRKNP